MWRWLFALGCLGCSIDRTGGAPLDGDVGEADGGPLGVDAGPGIDAGPGMDAGPGPGDAAVDASVVPDSCRLVTFYEDADGDGRGNAARPLDSCSMPPGYVLDATDCDDTCSVCFVGAVETCDTFDNDCNAIADDGVGETFYADADGDGFGDDGSSIVACTMPAGYVRDATDCDDGCARCWVGFPEELCGDLADNDCDGMVDEAGCPCAYFAVSSGNYAYCPTHTTYPAGQAHCASLGGYLASFETRAENDAVWAAVDARNDFIWIGGSDAASESNWVWESGMPLGSCAGGSCSSCASLCNWDGGQPNGGTGDNCAFMHPDWMGRWGDWPCDTTFGGGFAVLCELP